MNNEKFAIEHLEGLGITAKVIETGKLYTTYIDFAKASGYPEAVVNIRTGNDREKSLRGSLLKGKTVKVLAKGKHGTWNDILYVVQSEEGECFMFGEDGLEISQSVIEQMQAEIAELKARVGVLEYECLTAEEYKIKAPEQAKSPQQIRDEVVEKAKRDVAELSTSGMSVRVKSTSKQGYSYIDNYGIEFVVNSDKRTVVALLHGNFSKLIRIKGIAKCTPGDCFNAHLGKAIALRRAMGLEVPSEYMNAPQPTEVRVGDVVTGGREGYYSADKRFTITSETEFRSGFYYEEEHGDWIEPDQIGRIIDDSREKEE